MPLQILYVLFLGRIFIANLEKSRIDSKFFLKNNDIYTTLPRTTLRYAIEKFDEDKRQSYLKGRI